MPVGWIQPMYQDSMTNGEQRHGARHRTASAPCVPAGLAVTDLFSMNTPADAERAQDARRRRGHQIFATSGIIAPLGPLRMRTWSPRLIVLLAALVGAEAPAGRVAARAPPEGGAAGAAWSGHAAFRTWRRWRLEADAAAQHHRRVDAARPLAQAHSRTWTTARWTAAPALIRDAAAAADGDVVLVQRGWVPRDAATAPPDAGGTPDGGWR